MSNATHLTISAAVHRKTFQNDIIAMIKHIKNLYTCVKK